MIKLSLITSVHLYKFDIKRLRNLLHLISRPNFVQAIVGTRLRKSNENYKRIHNM